MRPVPAWLSPVILGLSAAVLAMRWDSIPSRFIVHWDAYGQPNGWMEKSVAGVLFPILLGLAMWVFFEIIGAVVRTTNRGKHERVAFAVVDTIRFIGIVLSVLFAVLAVALPLGPALSPALIGGGTIIGVALATTLGCVKISRATKALRAQNPHDGDLEGYHGFYYSNPNDMRLWVPKIVGPGSTINFAHPWAWPVMVLLVGVPIVFAIGTIVLTTRR